MVEEVLSKTNFVSKGIEALEVTVKSATVKPPFLKADFSLAAPK